MGTEIGIGVEKYVWVGKVIWRTRVGMGQGGVSMRVWRSTFFSNEI